MSGSRAKCHCAGAGYFGVVTATARQQQGMIAGSSNKNGSKSGSGSVSGRG